MNLDENIAAYLSPAHSSPYPSTGQTYPTERCVMTVHTTRPARNFRSRDWFDDPERIDQSAIYLERFMNYGITPEELRSGKPIIGIAQTGRDLLPCNRIHIE